MTFKSLGLSDAFIKAVEEKGYTKPSPIQQKAIPQILQGKDVLASAQTGTGKTAGFTLPVLQYLTETKHPKYRPLRALVLTPTRELAAQVYDNVREYSKYVNIKSAVVFGGVKPASQIATLKRGVDILVATPGRLLDLHDQKAVSFKRIDVLILDEADRMLDMGFVRDINKIISFMPAKRQNLMFSATFSKDIKKLANGILKNPVEVETAPQNSTAKKVTHSVFKVDKKRKTEFTVKLIKENNWNQVLIFTRTKHGANKLTQNLVKAKISAAAIHGNKSQGARTKALRDFKDNSIRVLVATDIAARGLDIPLLPHVINYELPNVPEDYVHRIGRTGRAGAKGEAISLVCSEETEYQKEIEKLLKEELNSTVVEGFEPTDTAAPKRAATQKKGSFKKKSNSTSSNTSSTKKPKRKPHFKGNKPNNSSGRGRTGAPKKKRI
ncbi:ATP-dependent RNA helicase RhlE [Polaribacter reichenbachii]|uniref:DEAD-box ATP-dependent RNA helicase RhpA n=1 Tax=Polaribacter reichenbachii TaxID=996801 RepID=A0A1B8TUE2_9FLAO|nr:DEAD/DEAH box helicase [Polaribacter reichenbachii]APZ45804.1 ATP-dependent RNA helicase RhlE [Polaribacter reichenbachii]AUC19666.1 ATP-dependent RNA helicase RhlE [Polaribacter reichenbachii]OBY63178.1 ATP-dependent RNA helicase RhlE [Polaribacter reichenbachii]